MNFLKSNKDTQISQSVLVGIMLATVGGFLDAYTYILRGKVFATAQTGNIVLLGIKLAEGAFYDVLKYCAPILAFVLGVVIVEIIRKKYRYAPNFHWRQIIIGIEILVLVGIGFMPHGDLDLYANIAISFVSSMQVQSFRLLNGNSYTTTMCTGNLRSATEELFRYSIKKDVTAKNNSLQYLTVILFFILGAILGAICSKYIGVKSVWVCCVILVVVFGLMFIRKKQESNGEQSQQSENIADIVQEFSNNFSQNDDVAGSNGADSATEDVDNGDTQNKNGGHSGTVE